CCEGWRGRHTCSKQPDLRRRPPSDQHAGGRLISAVPTSEITEDSSGRRRAVKRRQQRVMLTTLWLWPDGPWAILSWPLADNEEATSWGAFGRGLIYQGGDGIDHPTDRQ